MPRLSVFALFMICVVTGQAQVWAADRAGGEGSFLVAGRTYKLTKFVAYKSKHSEFDLVTVLASDRNLPLAKIKAMVAKGEDVSLDQPYLQLTFDGEGKLQRWNGWADNASFSAGASDVTGELKLDDGRAAGEFSTPPKGNGGLRRSFTMNFSIPMGLDASAPAAAKTAPAQAVKPSVAGKFLGNGKPAKLAFVSVHRREAFDDKPAFQAIFTEKDHSKDPKPDFSAGFGKFGSALLISFTEEGSVFGCEVAHAAHAKKPFSALGSIKIVDFDVDERHVQGQLTTDGEQDAFGQKWDVDLKFAAPLAAAAGANKTAVSKPAAPNNSSSSSPSKKPGKPTVEPTKPAVAAINVHDLPWPTNVTDVEYKALVHQMTFKSTAKVQALAAEITKKFAAQGWRSGDTDLVTPKSAILERKRGDASLTIMLKPDGAGSQATVFTAGLDWEEK